LPSTTAASYFFQMVCFTARFALDKASSSYKQQTLPTIPSSCTSLRPPYKKLTRDFVPSNNARVLESHLRGCGNII